MSDLFEDGQQAPTPAPAPVTPPAPAFQIPDEVSGLIGEGKKYADPVKALLALPHAQDHIARLEAENRALREKEAEGRSVAELLEVVQGRQAAPQTPDVAVDANAVRSLVQQEIAAREQERIASENAKQVQEALVASFGEKAKDAFATKAAEYGMTTSEPSALAKRSPKAALDLFGLKAKQANVPKQLASSVNTEILAGRAQPEAPRKSVMFAATTGDLVGELRHHMNKVLKENS